MVTRIGLTGGIGSGKSTVARMLVERGARLVDADAIARQLMEPGQPALSAAVQAFGQEILNPDGSLNRPALAALVFADESKRQVLNGIVHPLVRAESARQVEAARAELGEDAVVVEDIPLLAETGQADRFDGVLVVEVEQGERLRRLVEFRGMDEADARARMAAQASDGERRALATWVIDNSGSLEQTEAQVGQVWSKILRHKG
ncbi:dephospho-CoA kinase [Rothia nasimurium]|uniref:dephospho-CoA kinase n=1 Tax=Rothia nasimurium TaxID=85336 RepID=UPI001F017D9E|nr:dephospho-CoA kinase [Rothia nasimurium]